MKHDRMLQAAVAATVVALAAGGFTVGYYTHGSHHEPSVATEGPCPSNVHLLFVSRADNKRALVCVGSNSRIIVPLSERQFGSVSGLAGINGIYDLDTQDPLALVTINGQPVVKP